MDGSRIDSKMYSAAVRVGFATAARASDVVQIGSVMCGKSSRCEVAGSAVGAKQFESLMCVNAVCVRGNRHKERCT